MVFENLILLVSEPLGFVSCFSMVAQMVKNLPAMWETRIWSLGWEDSLEKEWLPAPIFLPRKSHRQRSLAGLQSMVSQRAEYN